MEGGTYAQINYNPDDLDDVSITEVELQEKDDGLMVTQDVADEGNSKSEDYCDNVDEIILNSNSDIENKEIYHEKTQELEKNESINDIQEDQEISRKVLDSSEFQNLLSRYEECNEDIQRTLRRLEKKFNEEILNGENRDSAVKTMYKELNEYKAGIVEKVLKNVLYDVIDIREMMLSQIRYFREKKGQDTISLEEFESYANDIGDILEKHDVTIYKGKPGEENIAVRQKIVRKVETEDDSLVKKVAESLSYGYEYGSKILYPEKISVYIKKK